MDEGYYKTRESVDEYIRLAEGFTGQQLIDKLKEVLADDSVLLELGSWPR